MDRATLLRKLEAAWADFQASYGGLPEAAWTVPGVVGEWSVKDLVAHVTTWEEEALKYLPLIAEGGSPPRYKTYGGLDAFNALRSEQKRDLSVEEVRQDAAAVHARLVAYLRTAPEEQFTSETRFRHRLRLDTYSHYPLHTNMILEWRVARGLR